MHQNTAVKLKRFILPLLLILLVIVSGTVGFMFLEKYTFLDSLYMTMITISTIGYGEVHHLDSTGRIFNIFLIIGSLSTTAFAFSIITRYVIDGEMNLFFKNRRLMKEIQKLEGHVIVCGYGRNGKQATETLKLHKTKFVIIEMDDQRIAEIDMEDNKTLYVKGDATLDETLLKAGILNAKALVTALPKDADNVFIVLSARSLSNTIQIISRASNAGSVAKLKKAGADNVILPDKIGGTHMATLVTKPDVIEFIDYLSGEEGEAIHLEAVSYQSLPNEIKDKSLSTIMQWRKTGVNCLGVKNDEGKFVINPDDGILITKGMKVIVLGSKEQIAQMKGNVESGV